MFELQIWDGHWRPILRSHELSRLIRFLGNLKNMQIFPADARYRVIFLKIILA